MGTIKQVHFILALKPQGNLMLVELDTGQYCLVHNDRLLIERRWPHEQVGRAVAAFAKMKAKLTAADLDKERSAAQTGEAGAEKGEAPMTVRPKLPARPSEGSAPGE